MDQPLLRRARDCRVSRISPSDTNKFVMMADAVADRLPFVSVVEIFDVGGKTPPNMHPVGQEMFFVLQGEGVARCDGQAVTLRAGDSLLVKPGAEHVIENTGAGRLYCLQVMVPNDAFAELIRNGTPAALDAEDLAVLRRVGPARTTS